ncbi:MAG: hypothetical protein H0U54_01020 [Acidobacteria bacterium]|nr:hypothetical protein [Acidobacteriota bacterium]
MPTRPSKLPRDVNERAKRILDIFTGDVKEEPPREKNAAAVALGRLGASKGGQARAVKLSPAKRKAIAKKAAEARWNKEA